jgi:hypothetical protein
VPARRLALDAAWAEAEAALPVPESVIEGVAWENGKFDEPVRYHARAYRWDKARPWERLYADGPTPAAALHALAARLSSTDGR